MGTKSEKISFLGRQVSLADREIKTVKDNKNKMCKIVFYDGSGHLEEITVWNQLHIELSKFLIRYFESEKEKYYSELQEELKKQ